MTNQGIRDLAMAASDILNRSGHETIAALVKKMSDDLVETREQLRRANAALADKTERLSDTASRYCDAVDLFSTGFDGNEAVILGERQREIGRQLGLHAMPTKAQVKQAEPELVPLNLLRLEIQSRHGRRLTDTQLREVMKSDDREATIQKILAKK